MPDESIQIPIEIKPVKGFDDLAKVSTVVTKAVQLMEANVDNANATLKNLGSTLTGKSIAPLNVSADTTAAIAKINQLIALADKTIAPLEISADTTAAITKINQLIGLVDKSIAPLEIGADTSAAITKVNQLIALVDKTIAPLEIGADTSAAIAKINELVAIADKTIAPLEISADTSSAISKINELVAQSDKKIAPLKVGADTAAAIRKLNELVALAGKNIAPLDINANISPARNALNILTNQFERLKKIAALPNLNFTQLERVNGLLSRTSNEIDRFGKSSALASRSFSSITGSSGTAAFALTNFGRIAQDLPYGMIGIANNITPLIESMQRLAAEAKATGVSMGKQLLNSLKGGGGLILGFSVLTSVMQFAAIGLSAFTRGMGSAGGAAGFAASEMEKVNVVMAKSAGSVQGQIAEINALVKAYGDTSSLKQQARILSELKEKNESYFGELKAGKTTLDELTSATNAYTQALVNQAIVDGLKNAISKLAEEYGNLFIKYQDQTKAANAARIEQEKTIRANRTTVQGMTAQNAEVNLATNKFNKLQVALGETGIELGQISTRMNEFTDQIQVLVAKQLTFKPLKKEDKKEFEDLTDEIIAHARQFVKEFGDVFVVPDLEDSFFKNKGDILKAAQKLLTDISKGNLKIKLPAIEFDASEGLVPFTPQIDPNFKLDPDGKIRAAFLEQMKAEFEEPFIIDPSIRLAVDNEKIKADLNKALKSGDFKAALDAIDLDPKKIGIQGLSDDIKTAAGLMNDTLTPAFQGLFDAIIKGENPLKAFFNSIIQSVNQVIQRLIAAAIQAAILSAVSGGAGGGFGSIFKSLIGGGGGVANFGNRVAFAGAGAGVANINVNGILRGPDIYLSGQAGGRSIGRAGG